MDYMGNKDQKNNNSNTDFIREKNNRDTILRTLLSKFFLFNSKDGKKYRNNYHFENSRHLIFDKKEDRSFSNLRRSQNVQLNVNSEIEILNADRLNNEISDSNAMNNLNNLNNLSKDYENLNNIIDKLLDNDIDNLNFEQFELLGEFTLEKNNESKTIFDSMKKKNSNENNNNRNISINSNLSESEINHEENIENPMYFLVYFRISNNVIDIILHDNSLMVKNQMDASENEIKKKILSKIAHEFKTPLNTIIGQINQMKEKYSCLVNPQEKKEMLKLSEKIMKKNQEDLLKNLDIINYLSNYTLYLIKDLMQYMSNEKIEKIQVDFNKVNLRNIVHFSFEILKTLVSLNSSKKENVKTFIKFDDFIDSIEVLSDEVRLNQILLNLVSNAVKFTHSGFIEIKCLYDRRKKEIIISVEDTGIGIKNEEKDLVFFNERGRSINLQYEHNKMGSGYGLKISYEISKKLEHELSFKSAYELGTVFYLKLFPKKDSISKAYYSNVKNYFKSGIEVIPRRIKSSRDNNLFAKFEREENKINNLPNFNHNKNNLIQFSGPYEINRNDIERNINNNFDAIDRFLEIRSNLNSPSNRRNLVNNPIENLNSIENISNRNKSNNSDFSKILKHISSLEDEEKSNPTRDKYGLSGPLNDKDQNPQMKKKEKKENEKENENEINYIINDEDNDEDNNLENNIKIINKNKSSVSKSNKISSRKNLKKRKRAFSTHSRKLRHIKNNNNNIKLNKIITDNYDKNDINNNSDKKIILIIDDNDILRNSMVNMVAKCIKKKDAKLIEKYSILSGNDGRDLIKYFLDDIYLNKIEYIFTDENMNIINGSIAVKIIREIERMKFLRKSKVILASTDKIFDYEKNGFNMSIEKPFNLEELTPIIFEN